MARTEEQQKIIDTCVSVLQKKDKDNALVKISAVAGSGKTFTLIEIAKELEAYCRSNNLPFTGRYLAYNKSIAEEASEEFPKYVECSTVHSMAYRATVRQFNLKLGPTLKPLDFKDRCSYQDKQLLIFHLNEFYLSEFVTVSDYIVSLDMDDGLNHIEELMKKYMKLMSTGQFPCSHAFYLKFYHILLANDILKPAYQTMLSMDESGDCNSVTIEIFKLLKADIKIMAGDQYQNIYGFNNTINGFKSMENQGILTTLSKTFRVSANIASKIESFAKEYIDENFVFIGNEYESKTEDSIAYISRNNSMLIDKMISFDNKNIPYNLTRSPQKMFEVPLTILNLKPYKDVLNKEYKFLEKDAIEFHEDLFLQREYGTLFKYIMNKHSDDIAIKSACTLIMKHGPGKIFETYDNAKNHAVGENKHLITLTTAHSSKGLTFDTVHILPDLNESLTKTFKEVEELMYLTNLKIEDESEHVTLKDCMNQYQLESMLLYYVAVSRTKHRLYNAEHLMDGNLIE